MLTLGEFHQLVSDSLRRGTAQDAYIPGQVKLAAKWLERNYTMRYMERFRLLQVAPNDRTIQFPDNIVVKAVKFIRLIGEDGRYRELRQVDPRDLRSTGIGYPEAFWKVGDNVLVLNATSDVALAGEGVLFEYTDWPTADDSTHPLINLAADVLLQQSLLFLAAFLRDPDIGAVYKVLRDEALDTLTRAEDEGVHGGASYSMAFGAHPP